MPEKLIGGFYVDKDDKNKLIKWMIILGLVAVIIVAIRIGPDKLVETFDRIMDHFFPTTTSAPEPPPTAEPTTEPPTATMGDDDPNEPTTTEAELITISSALLTTRKMEAGDLRIYVESFSSGKLVYPPANERRIWYHRAPKKRESDLEANGINLFTDEKNVKKQKFSPTSNANYIFVFEVPVIAGEYNGAYKEIKDVKVYRLKSGGNWRSDDDWVEEESIKSSYMDPIKYPYYYQFEKNTYGTRIYKAVMQNGDTWYFGVKRKDL